MFFDFGSLRVFQPAVCLIHSGVKSWSHDYYIPMQVRTATKTDQSDKIVFGWTIMSSYGIQLFTELENSRSALWTKFVTKFVLGPYGSISWNYQTTYVKLPKLTLSPDNTPQTTLCINSVFYIGHICSLLLIYVAGALYNSRSKWPIWL